MMKRLKIAILGLMVFAVIGLSSCQSATQTIAGRGNQSSDTKPSVSSPRYWNFLWINGSAEINVALFNFGQRLEVQGGEELRGFEVAGKDRVFHPANAEISQQTTAAGELKVTWINLKSDQVKEPFYIRYAQGEYESQANLVNSSGERALPFQTHSQCAFAHPK